MHNAFDPDELRSLCEAFEAAWEKVGPLADSSNHEQVRDHIAKAILAMAEAGQRDSEQLARYATAKVTVSVARPPGIARWLLMVGERSQTPHLSVSHEDIAYALGMRRAGVTEAISSLGEAQCIWTSRRHIEIIDRNALIRASGGCFP